MRNKSLSKFNVFLEAVAEKKVAAQYNIEDLMFAKFDKSFNEYGDYYIPLYSKAIQQIFSNIDGYGWHLTTKENLEQLKKIQNTNRSISTLHVDDFNKDILNKGITTKPDYAVLVKGDVLLKYNKNAWTVVDENGDRWLPVQSYKSGAKVSNEIEHIKQKYEYTLEDIASSIGYNSWVEVYNKWDNLTSVEKDNIQEKFTESMTEFIVKNKRLIKDNIWKAIDVSEQAMSIEGVEEGFNEIVISDFEIVKIVDIDKIKDRN